MWFDSLYLLSGTHFWLVGIHLVLVVKSFDYHPFLCPDNLNYLHFPPCVMEWTALNVGMFTDFTKEKPLIASTFILNLKKEGIFWFWLQVED